MNYKIHKLLLVLLTAGLLEQTLLHAQFVTTSTTNPYTGSYDFEFRSDGTLLAKGGYGTGALTSTDTGSMFLWYVKADALRAGYFTSTELTTSTYGDLIGSYSVALGYETTATRSYSTAMGKLSNATGIASTAIGYGLNASGDYSTAFGNGNTSSGDYSFSAGVNNHSFGNYSFTAGSGNTVLAVTGLYGAAFGHSTTAEGYYTMAIGYQTDAVAAESLAIGRYNLTLSSTGTAASATTWVLTDPLFEIGNGTSSAPADALVVYKDGSMKVQGPITVTNTGGDIPMFNGY